MMPVLEARLNPVGNEPDEIDQVSGVVPPVAASVCEYAVPLVPPGIGVAVVIDGAAAIVMESDLVVLAAAPSLS